MIFLILLASLGSAYVCGILVYTLFLFCSRRWPLFYILGSGLGLMTHETWTDGETVQNWAPGFLGGRQISSQDQKLVEERAQDEGAEDTFWQPEGWISHGLRRVEYSSTSALPRLKSCSTWGSKAVLGVVGW